MKFRNIFKSMLYAVCFVMILTQTCYAYIDPATTSYIIQIIAGIIIACGTVLGIFWNKLTRAFKKKKSGKIEEIKMEDSTVNAGGKTVITAEDLLDDEGK